MTFGGAGTSSNEDSTYCHIMISSYSFGLTTPFREWKKPHSSKVTAWPSHSAQECFCHQIPCTSAGWARRMLWYPGTQAVNHVERRKWDILDELQLQQGLDNPSWGRTSSHAMLQPAQQIAVAGAAGTPELSWSPGHLWAGWWICAAPKCPGAAETRFDFRECSAQKQKSPVFLWAINEWLLIPQPGCEQCDYGAGAPLLAFLKHFFTSDLSVFKLLSYSFAEAYSCSFTCTNNRGDK